MARKPRSEEIDEDEVGIYHVTSRCVRRAFLMGNDPVARKSYDERREWLIARLIWMVRFFKIDVLSFSIMANHLHLVLRIRPDLVAEMSSEELIRAWWEISPQCRKKNGAPGSLTDKRLQKLLKDAKHIGKCRERLSSISWFMRYLKHPLALKANFIDGRSGHFFEGRFRVKKMESLEQLSHAMIYSDLNPIRAGLARSIKDSAYTSARLRYQAVKQRIEVGREDPQRSDSASLEQNADAGPKRFADDWLSPIQIREDEPIPAVRSSAHGTNRTDTCMSAADFEAKSSPCHNPQQPTRASDLGVLPMTDEKYLALVDIMGRRAVGGKRGAIPPNLPPILREMGITEPTVWLTMYDEYEEAVDNTYQSKVNSDEEARLVELILVDPSRTNQDAMM